MDPLLVLVCVDHKARTHAHLYARKRFGVNVLAENQRSISEYYARSGPTSERAAQEAGARFDRTAHGTPVLHGALAYLECRLHTAKDAGDHTIFIAEIRCFTSGGTIAGSERRECSCSLTSGSLMRGSSQLRGLRIKTLLSLFARA
jgi:flavin reductase (DIM6/NTAB) family NADH-FMN oxidoreductase RutF